MQTSTDRDKMTLLEIVSEHYAWKAIIKRNVSHNTSKNLNITFQEPEYRG